MSLARNRKVCVVTDSRAEYGLLHWTMKEIEKHVGLDLQVVVCGGHLSPEFGQTYKVIENDGFRLDGRVEMTLSGDTPSAISKSIGLGCIGFADTFENLQPDIIVLLGDRYELLAAAQAALIARIPIAHIHGGETTEGAIDEAIRHSITKMSHLHFTTADEHRRRVIQLGEMPDRVYNFGAPGLDHLRHFTPLSRQQLGESLNMKLDENFFLVTYHPVTLAKIDPGVAMKALLHALDQFPDYQILITAPNTDTAGRTLFPIIQNFAAERPARVAFEVSLGQERYLSALSHASAVVGNSSSGLIEAPSIPVATVNIGERQRGRLRAASVVNCAETENDISTAIAQALTSDHQAVVACSTNPYDSGETASRIVSILAKADLEGIVLKKFYDLPGEATG
jgi:UDP-hydrolysing UDP-N-acetyl-D-glucosamine 2-epimerase